MYSEPSGSPPEMKVSRRRHFGDHEILTETAQDVGSSLKVALLDIETRRLRQEEETNGKDDSPQHLDGNGDSVRASIHSVLGAIVDTGSKQQPDCDAELVARYYRTTNLLGSDLGHVENNDGGDETDTKTSNQSTSDEEAETGRGSLQNNTNDEDKAPHNNGSSATKP
jgi:hypothetical protein